MPEIPSVKSLLSDWKVADRGELLKAWQALVPEGDARAHGVRPKFLGRELNDSEAGFVFERWIIEAFRLDGAEVEPPFRVLLLGQSSLKEELDGLVVHGWQGFLLQSKFEAARVDLGPIAQLHVQVASRPVGTLGLFFSISGYTEAALELARALRPLCVLLFDGDDLRWALGQQQGMIGMVRRKWIDAVKYGLPNLGASSEEAADGLEK
jgi:hypothetical protein